jgi:crossover junction endodeoxyribonuclease RuvC
MSEPRPFVVGIDLSLTATGLSDLDLDSGRFSNVDTYGTKGKRGDKYAQRGDRLRQMVDYIVSWATAGPQDPSLVVIEGPALGNTKGSQFDRSGLWWLVVDDFLRAGIPVLVVPPKTRAKYATGNGNAGKETVVAHAVETYTHLIDHGDRIDNDNEADAVVLAAIGARYLGYPVEEELPQANLDAMSGVEAL